jgi:hypothetical protein
LNEGENAISLHILSLVGWIEILCPHTQNREFNPLPSSLAVVPIPLKEIGNEGDGIGLAKKVKNV